MWRVVAVDAGVFETVGLTLQRGDRSPPTFGISQQRTGQ